MKKRLMLVALICGATTLFASDDLGHSGGCCNEDCPIDSLVDNELPEGNTIDDYVQKRPPGWGPPDTRHICEV